MPKTHKTKRINIGLADRYLDLLEQYSSKIGKLTAASASHLIELRLEEMVRTGELTEASDNDLLIQFIDYLSGHKEDVNLEEIAEVTGKPLEVLEAIAHQKGNGGRIRCCEESK